MLNALYYVPALLAIWVRPPAEEEKELMADVEPEELRPDRSFAGAAVVLTAAIIVLGIFYHPVLNVIEAGLRLM